MFKITPSNHKKGRGCPKCSNRNKSFEELIEYCNSIHNSSFIYHKINNGYKRFKIQIECKKHGITTQEFRHHIQGHGCRLCTDESLSGSSWSYSDWGTTAKTSKHFDSFKVYIIRCFNENEEFIKIGRTFRKIDLRFSGIKTLPYNYQIIKILDFDNPQLCCETEKELHLKYSKYKYTPLIFFNGRLECYSKNIMDLIND